jgi:hypothetical protein
MTPEVGVHRVGRGVSLAQEVIGTNVKDLATVGVDDRRLSE